MIVNKTTKRDGYRGIAEANYLHKPQKSPNIIGLVISLVEVTFARN